MLSKKYSKFFSKKPLRFSTKFRRPKTAQVERLPKYQRKFSKITNNKEYLKIIKNPVTTESAMKKIQSGNTLVFIVSPRSNKKTIKLTIKKLYKAKAIKINTLITTNGEKKAYIKLSPDSDALDVANRIGFI